MTEIRLPCPCCRFPSLSSRGSYDVCLICWWEDDGQDDADAGRISGGPNGDYSLTSARLNFQAHGHMYAKGKGIDVVEHPNANRLRLLDYIDAIRNGTTRLDQGTLDRLLNKPQG